MKKAFTAGLCILSLHAFATDNISGTFDVKRGFSETMSVSQTEQLGRFKFVMKDENNTKLKIKGTIRGVLDPTTFSLSHTAVNKERTGTMITAGDSITNILGGDPSCANGSEPFQVEEILFIVAGTGIYSNVEAGSFITVEGVINNCPGLPNFLQNNFSVTGGTVTFADENPVLL